MARKYARKFKKSRGYKKFGKRRTNRTFGRRRNVGGSSRRRLYDNRLPLQGTMYSGKPVYATVNAAGTVAAAPKRDTRPAGDVVRLGDNTSMSATYLGRRKKGMRSMLSNSGNGGIKKLYNNSVGQYNGTTGVQDQITVGTLSRTDLNTIKTSLEGDLPAEFKPSTNDLKVFFGEQVSRLHMKNQTNHVACVVIYDIIPKRLLDTSTLDSPKEAWDAGCNQQGMTAYSTYPGNSPFESKEFTKRFQVVKSTRMYLEPGEQHEHVFVRRINRVYSSCLWDSKQASAGENIFGLTGYTMVVAYGSIGHSNTDVPGSVSYMPVRIDYIHHTTNQFQYVGTTLKKTVLGTNNISTTAPTTWNHIADAGDVEAGLINA